MKKLTLAMPQLIPQSKLNPDYVEGWRKYAASALKNANLTPIKMQTMPYLLYHKRKSNTAGVWFISQDGITIDYLYAYQSVQIKGQPKASEALAFRFAKRFVRGVTKEIFFDHMLPDLRFIVTDSMYTPDGLGWFEAEYIYAYHVGHKVYAIDMRDQASLHQITEKEFDGLQPLYWGMDDLHQQYRFAIEHK